jgi:hypothetical protein
LRQLLQGILDREEDKERMSVERCEYNKLMKTVVDCMKERIEQGDTTITISSFKEQYQQLIDPVKP